jgi:hypothetical protein
MYEWSEPIVETAENKGIKVDHITDQKVVKAEIVSRIKKLNPNFIILNGHGNSKTFFGYEDQFAIEIKDAHLFKDKVVFCRACNCLKKLGKETVDKHGCKSFIGYEFEFVNVRQTNIELNPKEDKISKPIWETSNVVPICLIKGSTVVEAIEASHKRATSEILRLLTHSKELGAIDVLRAIIVNDDGLNYCGDGSATI